jgi:DNA-binding transcriptional regulator YhcF (GntR family)
MELRIDTESSTAPYEQVRSQITELVRSGALAPGAKLPTVRGLAGDLGLAVNTVARSYRELERDGVIETRGRKGSFVAHDGTATEQAAMAEAEAYAARIRQLGLTPAEGMRLASRALGHPD